MATTKKHETAPISAPTRHSASTRAIDSVKTWPTHPISDVPLASLIDIESLRSLLDDFSALIGVTTALLDLEGNILQSAGWQKACTVFHRAVPDSCANCTESDLFLAGHLRQGEFVDYKCKNGLWDVVTPIFVGDRHLGNLYFGQFFYDDDVVDEHFFASRAVRFGYDQALYLAAIREIPRFSREYVRRVMTHIVGLAAHFSHLSLTNLKLSESRAQMETLINTLPDPVWLKDAEGVFVACNNALGRMFGAPTAEIVGKTDYDFCAAERADSFRRKDIETIVASEPTVTEEWLISAESGQPVLLETIKTALRGVTGKPVGVLGIGRDITERKREAELLRQAKAEADQANNAKSRFLASASHDLRQPLAALRFYADVLKNQVAPPQQALLGSMDDCIANLSGLLNDLLDLSKLEAGVVKPKITDFSVFEFFATLESVYLPKARAKGLRLRFLPNRLTSRSDPVILKRIVGNIIENAIRYTERGGVVVGCRRRQGRIWVEVWDSGIGISADQTTEIFEEFKQLGDQARNQGSGLGLAIVAKSAALLGLEFSVRSRPGRGSVFVIELPCGQSEAAIARPPAAACHPLRIALVEDNRMVREALVLALQDVGHEVIAAANGGALLTALGNTPPDVILSDYRLTHGETGFDVIAAVRKAMGSELPAIIITGDTDPKFIASINARGMAVVHKPLDIKQLQASLEHLPYPAR